MSRLKKKVFFTVFTILTLSLLCFISVFNVQNYVEQRNNVAQSLIMATNNGRSDKDFDKIKPSDEMNRGIQGEEPKPLDENIRFMDSVIYTVLLDSDDNIIDIINHSNLEFQKNEINNIANQLLNRDNIKTSYIGSLYFNDYSYEYIKGNCLVIIDNTRLQDNLFDLLKNSIILFLLLELIAFAVSKRISERITKPVQESFEKQKQFVADASHELKTPLSVIAASSEAIEECAGNKKWLDIIKNETDRMNFLITDLLELASSENEKSMELAEGNISKEIELSVLTFEGIAFEKQVKLNYEIKDNILLKMNAQRIKQLVEILLDNAVQHSAEGTAIHVTLSEEKNSVFLSVANEGSSIPEGDEEKIFERFYRSDKSRNRNDNRYGLGLAIAKNIVLNHNGKISASSQNDTTVFTVIFKK